MTPEELDVEIARLLEEQPNQEKPERRRRNKIKDLEKEARRGTYTIPKKVIREMIGDDAYHRIDNFSYIIAETEQYRGVVNGWYDDIKEIARTCKVPTDWVRLEKIADYDWESGSLYWDGDSRVYTKVVNYETRFYTEDGKYIAYRGLTDTDGTVEKPTLIEDGYIYEYNEESKAILEEFYGDIPATKQLSQRSYYDYWIDINKLEALNETNKYEKYRKLLKIRDESNLYGKTEPIQNGNPIGKHRDLIKVMNTNSRLGKDLLEGTDTYIMDYEEAHSKIIYDYYW